jgi:TPR repeat protein
VFRRSVAARVCLAFLSVSFVVSSQPLPGRPPLRERAAKGDPEAQFTLGKNYEAGRGGLKKDYTEAYRWYRLAADQGDPFAQASVALLYRFGKGVPRDYVRAYMWFQISADRLTGPDQASILELRDAAGSHMNAEQIAEAVRLAREWKPKLP